MGYWTQATQRAKDVGVWWAPVGVVVGWLGLSLPVWVGVVPFVAALVWAGHSRWKAIPLRLNPPQPSPTFRYLEHRLAEGVALQWEAVTATTFEDWKHREEAFTRLLIEGLAERLPADAHAIQGITTIPLTVTAGNQEHADRLAALNTRLEILKRLLKEHAPLHT